MADIQSFIQQAATSLGIDESVSRKATGGLLEMVQKHAGNDLFSQIADKIPGAGALAAEAPSLLGGGSSVGGMLGGLASKATGALGGNAGAALSVMTLLKQTGLDSDQGSKLATMLFEFVKNAVGPELTSQLLDKAPELKKILG